MSKETLLKAAYISKSKKPRCPRCLVPVEETNIQDYGVSDEGDCLWFVSPCPECSKKVKYKTDFNHFVIVDNIIELGKGKENTRTGGDKA